MISKLLERYINHILTRVIDNIHLYPNFSNPFKKREVLNRKITSGIMSGLLLLTFFSLLPEQTSAIGASNPNGSYVGQTSVGHSKDFHGTNSPHGIQIYLTNKDDIGNIKNGLLHGNSFQVPNGNLATTTTQLVSSSTGFDGLTSSQSGGWYPPDVQVAAGTSHIVEMVNLEMEIFYKNGTAISAKSLPSFYGTGGDFISDPKIIFDDTTNRWFSIITDITTSKVLLAVSVTDDPTNSWKIFSFDFGSAFSYCPDQPILGLNDDKIVISTNQFSNKCGINGGGSSYVGAQYEIIDKNSVTTATSSTSSIPTSIVGPNSGLFSVHPSHMQGTTGTGHPIYLASVGSGSTSTMRLITVTGNPFYSNTTVTTNNISINAVGIPPDAQQSGTANLLATGDSRVQDAQWRNGKLWVAFNDSCTPSGDSSARSCLHLIQIDTNTINKNQDFVYGINGKYLFYPAMGIDGSNNLALVYGYSSSTEYPSLYATGQASGQSALQQPALIKAGNAYEGSSRYGDYFGAGVDPSDTTKVWTAGEYHSSSTSNWGTWISNIVVSTLPQDNTGTTVTVSSSPLTVGTSTTVTATILDTNSSSNTPTGSVIWTDYYGGSFASQSCNTSGNNLLCTATYTPACFRKKCDGIL